MPRNEPIDAKGQPPLVKLGQGTYERCYTPGQEKPKE